MRSGIGKIKLTRVKDQNLLGDNTKLKEWLKNEEKKKDDNSVVEGAKPVALIEGMDLEPLRDFKIPESCFYSEYDEGTLAEIMDEAMGVVKLLKSYGKSKHMANRLLIIFDDCVGSSLFNNRKQNRFKMLNANHRYQLINKTLFLQYFNGCTSVNFIFNSAIKKYRRP